eukprot:1158625-Pelagomonas_calceolata.AAC.1
MAHQKGHCFPTHHLQAGPPLSVRDLSRKEESRTVVGHEASVMQDRELARRAHCRAQCSTVSAQGAHDCAEVGMGSRGMPEAHLTYFFCPLWGPVHNSLTDPLRSGSICLQGANYGGLEEWHTVHPALPICPNMQQRNRARRPGANHARRAYAATTPPPASIQPIYNDSCKERRALCGTTFQPDASDGKNTSPLQPPFYYHRGVSLLKRTRPLPSKLQPDASD